MDRNTLAELLEALDSRLDTEERRSEELSTALIERVGLALSTAPAPCATPAMSAPKYLVMKMTAENDPEAYLVAFERMSAGALGKPAGTLSDRAMSDLSAASYDLVKLSVLRRINITAEIHRVRFREYRRSPETRPRVVAERLCDHTVHWLTPEKKTNLEMGKAMVVEQFCHVVSANTQAWIRCHNHDALEAAVKLA
ncbi:UNVERIFIED_CONTAM: hypothetical protein FKN15_028440 [Acipenser sinensis]